MLEHQAYFIIDTEDPSVIKEALNGMPDVKVYMTNETKAGKMLIQITANNLNEINRVRDEILRQYRMNHNLDLKPTIISLLRNHQYDPPIKYTFEEAQLIQVQPIL